MKLCALILVFLGVPDAADTPRAAVDRFVASLRSGELVAAYRQLGEGGQALVDKEVGGKAAALGLDPAAATTERILQEIEKRLGNDAGKQMLATFDVTVGDTRTDGDKASVKVRAALGGRVETVRLLLTRKSGSWRIDGVDTSEARSRANETAAIATLRNVTSAQAQFQATARADVDADGTGEYGFFGELSGGVAVRGVKKLVPPVLSRAFREPKNGVVTRSGYHFKIFLCDAKGAPIGEEKGTNGVDPDKAETVWCCYAWPVEYGKSGTRTFFINQFGDVLAVDRKEYSGKNGPKADAAFRGDGSKGRITGQAAIGAAGNDGGTWKQVG